jgi:hypothetical protein
VLIEKRQKILRDLPKLLARFEMPMGASDLVERQRLGSAVRLAGANLDGWQLVPFAAQKLPVLLSAITRPFRPPGHWRAPQKRTLA